MDARKFVFDIEKRLKKEFEDVDNLMFSSSEKVLDAMHEEKISESHFASTTGYGYNDIGRDAIERVFAHVLGAEKCVVRNQFISGSHALNVTFFALLRPGDTMLSITGEPYDTLKEVIGINDNPSSLKSFNISYEQIDLVNDDFDIDKIKESLVSKKYKLVHIQRSRGYSSRKSLTIDKLENVIKEIRTVDKDVIIMVDNCYCEFVESKTPLEVGTDVIVGSLIKNLGGGIAPNGAYVAGREDLIDLVGERLTLPGEGLEVGPSLGINKDILLGLYMAPNAVGSSLKVAILASLALEELGYKVDPKYNEKRADIVDMITFGNEQDLIKFVEGIQMGSAIDAHALPVPTDMPGYEDKVIMASGSFTQGSSIEISADGPLRKPYNAYMQGSLTYEYGKLALIKAIENMRK